MCGIAGIVYKKDIPGNREAVLKSMLASIAHRGPDDEGMYFDGPVALGHRRLSILDLSPAGHQPMKYKDCFIVYNGEVYNYLELREELKRSGHTFTTGTDTEVILHAYEEWGEECLSRFNGMWAFVIYDRRKQALFCSRDRFGVKPFYYYEDDEKFLFASEIKAILRAGVQAIPHREILEDYLFLGLLNHKKETFFSGITKLMPSQRMLVAQRPFRKEVTKYYSIPLDFNRNGKDIHEAVQTIQNELRRAVVYRLRSDVRVGSCLSGGLDSSSVVALAAGLTTKKDDFIAVTASSEDPENDESTYARRVAAHVGIRDIVVRPTYEDFCSALEDVVYCQEEPFLSTSIFMQYFVMKTARENGIKVLLDGQGGDETLFGYETYFPQYLKMLIVNLSLVEAIKFIRQVKNFKLSRSHMLRSALVTLVPRFLSHRVRLTRWKDNPYAKRAYLRNVDVFQSKSFKRFQIDQIAWLNVPQLVNYEDKNSMRFSVETRLPFLDYELVEKCVSMDDTLKVQRGFLKYILRSAMDDMLPRDITWRTNKFGFESPQKKWFAQHREKMIPEIRSCGLTADYLPYLDLKDGDPLWRVYNAALWSRISWK